jgi:hypothetical protein
MRSSAWLEYASQSSTLPSSQCRFAQAVQAARQSMAGKSGNSGHRLRQPVLASSRHRPYVAKHMTSGGSLARSREVSSGVPGRFDRTNMQIPATQCLRERGEEAGRSESGLHAPAAKTGKTEAVE